MRIGLALGTPLIADTWLGCVVANCPGDVVLCIEIGGDPGADAAWRVFPRPDVMLSRAIAYVCRDEEARQCVVRSWYRKCGALTGYRCESTRETTSSREEVSCARPRQPIAGAQARVA